MRQPRPWPTARTSARRARSLGAATARLHTALAGAFGTTPVDDVARAGLRDALRSRITWALSTTDALDRHRGALADRAEHLDLADLPPLQRVHGDYHLGQVLHSPTPRLGGPGLRGRAASAARRAHPARPRPARRGRHAPLVRLRRRSGPGEHPRRGRRGGGRRLGTRRPGRLLRRVRRRRRTRSPRGRRAARRARAGQGAVRGRLRGGQSPGAGSTCRSAPSTACSGRRRPESVRAGAHRGRVAP